MSDLYVVYGGEGILCGVYLEGKLYVFNGPDWNDSCDDPKTFVHFWTNGSWGGYKLEGQVIDDGRYQLKYESTMGGGMMGQYGHTEKECTVTDPTPTRALGTVLENGGGNELWEGRKTRNIPVIDCHPTSISDCMRIMESQLSQ
jgi:hypothetical protein